MIGSPLETHFAMLAIIPVFFIVSCLSDSPAYISFIRPRCATDF